MSYHGLFKQYIWLLNTILRAKRISFEEINRKWQQNYLNDGAPLSRTTFNRHKAAIEEMFDIVIDCDRHDGYCILNHLIISAIEVPSVAFAFSYYSE